jgi:uncharacterized protein YuzE
MTERISYFPDTDTMYVEVRPGPTEGGADAGPDLVIHYGTDGLPSGYEIERASRHPEHIAAALAATCSKVSSTMTIATGWRTTA